MSASGFSTNTVLPALEGPADECRVRVVPGDDEHGVERVVVEDGVDVGRDGAEAELALGVDAGERVVVATETSSTRGFSRRCGSSIDVA